MTGFRVVYSRGSFAFAIACASLEQALARAVSVSREAGVWHVQVEDQNGKPAALTSAGFGLHRGATGAFAPRQPATGLRQSPLPEVTRNGEDRAE